MKFYIGVTDNDWFKYIESINSDKLSIATYDFYQFDKYYVSKMKIKLQQQQE